MFYWLLNVLIFIDKASHLNLLVLSLIRPQSLFQFEAPNEASPAYIDNLEGENDYLHGELDSTRAKLARHDEMVQGFLTRLTDLEKLQGEHNRRLAQANQRLRWQGWLILVLATVIVALVSGRFTQWLHRSRSVWTFLKLF